MAKLGDICTIQSGGTPSRSNKEYWENGTIPWVKISDFSGKYLDHTSERITQAGLDGSSAKIFARGTILYTIFATLGETCILDIDATTNQAIAGLKINDDSVSLDYLYYYLLSKKEYVNEIGRGVAQNNINMKILREMEIVIPSKEEQDRITDVLNKIYTLITLRKEQHAKLDQLVQSKFVDLFEDSFKKSRKTIIDVAEDVTVGIANSATHAYADTGVVMLRNQNIRVNYLDDRDLIYITPDFANNYKNKALRANDILVTRTGVNVGMACLVPEKYSGCQTFTTLILRLKNDAGVLPAFVCYYINSPLGKAFIDNHKVGGAQPNFGAKQLAVMPIAVPPMVLQKQFAAFVEQTDKSKLAIQQSLDKLELLKKSLMQEYFG